MQRKNSFDFNKFDLKFFFEVFVTNKNPLSIKNAWICATREDIWKILQPSKTKVVFFNNSNYQAECEKLANISPVFQAKLLHENGVKSFKDFFVKFIREKKLFSDSRFSSELAEFIVEEFAPVHIHELLSEKEFVAYLLQYPKAQLKLTQYSDNLLGILLETHPDNRASEMIKLFLSTDSPLFSIIIKNASEKQLKQILEKYPQLPLYNNKEHYGKVLAMIESLEEESLKKIHAQSQLLNKVLESDLAFQELDVLQILKIIKVDDEKIFKLLLEKMQDWLKAEQNKNNNVAAATIFHLFSTNECTDVIIKKLYASFNEETIKILLGYFAEKYQQVSLLGILKVLKTNLANLAKGIAATLANPLARESLIRVLKIGICQDYIVDHLYSAINNLLNDDTYLTNKFVNDELLLSLFVKSDHNFIKKTFLSACKRNSNVASAALNYIIDNLLLLSNSPNQKKTSVELIKTVLAADSCDSFITADKLIALINFDNGVNHGILLNPNFMSKVAQGVNDIRFVQIIKPHYETILEGLANGASIQLLQLPSLALLTQHLRFTVLNLFQNIEQHAPLLIKVFNNFNLRQQLFGLIESQELLSLANTGDAQVIDTIFSAEFSQDHSNLFDHFILGCFSNIKDLKLAEKVFNNEKYCQKACQFLKLKDIDQLFSHEKNQANEKLYDLLLAYVDNKLLNELFLNKKDLTQLFIKHPLFKEKVINHKNFAEIATWYKTTYQSEMQKQLRGSAYFPKPVLPTSSVMPVPTKKFSSSLSLTAKTTKNIKQSLVAPAPLSPLPPLEDISSAASNDNTSNDNNSESAAPPPPPPPFPNDGSIPDAPPPPPPMMPVTSKNKLAIKTSGGNFLSQLSDVKLKSKEEQEPLADTNKDSQPATTDSMMAELKKRQAARKSTSAPITVNDQAKGDGVANKNSFQMPKLRSRTPSVGSDQDRKASTTSLMNGNGFHKSLNSAKVGVNQSAEKKASEPTPSPFGPRMLKKVGSKTSVPPVISAPPTNTDVTMQKK